MIGIDIGDSSIKLVRLSKKSRRRLQSYCWENMPEGAVQSGVIKNEDKVAQVIKKAMYSCKMDTQIKDVVVASIPETQSFLRVVEVPLMEEDEVAEAVQWEVAQHIPFGLENVYLDWQPLAGAGHEFEGRMEVLVGASQKKVVDSIYRVLNGIGLDVAALELESQAIIRALVSGELMRKQGLLIVDLGGSSTNVVVHDHGAMRFTASLQKGVRTFYSALSPADVKMLSRPPDGSTLKNSAAIAKSLRPYQEELVMEIRGIAEFYNGIDARHHVREIVLTGGGANLPGFDQVFLQYFDNVHVQRGNPWVNVLRPGRKVEVPMNLQESVHYTTALGLALREVVV